MNKIVSKGSWIYFNNISYETEYRFSLKIGNNEYVSYMGNKQWHRSQNNHIIQVYNEQNRDLNSIHILSKDNEKVELKESDFKESFPRWCNVWKKIDCEHYFYPISDKYWAELQEDHLFEKHKFIKNIKNDYYFQKNSGWYHFVLNEQLIGGDSLENLYEIVTKGSWIYLN